MTEKDIPHKHHPKTAELSALISNKKNFNFKKSLEIETFYNDERVTPSGRYNNYICT